jgi:hypothetical protein
VHTRAPRETCWGRSVINSPCAHKGLVPW